MTTGAAGSTEMTITTRDLPRAHRGQFYEAWLLDPATRKMLPLGELGPSGQASFEVDDRLLGRYSAVDVSLEADDGDPQHSVTSVLRASYDAPAPHRLVTPHPPTQRGTTMKIPITATALATVLPQALRRRPGGRAPAADAGSARRARRASPRSSPPTAPGSTTTGTTSTSSRRRC